MTAALDPEHALAFLALLSTDIRASVVTDGDGQVLAGSPELAAALESTGHPSPDEDVVHRPLVSGSLFAVSSRERSIAVEVGPHALSRLVEGDIRRTLRELA
jgi:hypothetical protein